MSNSISIQKRSLNHENFQENKLKNFFEEKLNISVEPTNRDLLISKAEKQFFDNISTTQITNTLILTATSLIEKDPIFDKIATQLLLQKTYRKVFQKKVNSNNFRELYQQSFINSLKIMVEKKKKNADPKLLEFDLEKLSQELVLERDNLFNYIGLEVVYSRYL
ncbi:17004_t:CDS:1 [Funneliformis geosporum]|uniref:7706_t:CDS:1 n=1 Tax=Funneliformis geosporum TaxID=1117311 RepID=A0A9W4SD99_9GLOM|nr:17004_t:CDS:1 [Funneliformis geosporum]CAI2165138.1 7706_t:CDS:1 [Funneliformis geosporum]